MEDFDTFTITGGPLKAHEYIIIKREMSAADEAYVQNQGMAGSGTKKNPQVQLLMGNARLALVKRMIVRWSLTRTVTGPDGSETQVAIELSDRAIENLSRRVFNYVYKIINELNPDEEEESDEDFSSAANGHSESVGSNLIPMKTTRKKA